MKRLITLLAIITVLLSAVTVHAQDATLHPSDDCHPDDITADLQAQATALDPDADDFMSQLQELQVLAGTSRLKCAGMVLSGSNEAGKKVLCSAHSILPKTPTTSS